MSVDLVPIAIRGTGSYAPTRILTNDDLSHMVDTSDEWILSRTGIRQRRIAAENENTSDMAARAGAAAIEAAGLTPGDIDIVIVGTITPDMLFPATACLVQHKLGIVRAMAFDLEAACSGFLYLLETASALLQTGKYRNALIIGAEKMSSILDWKDRSTCVLFGDGAGAVVLGRADKPDTGFLGAQLGADGQSGELLYLPAGGTAVPASAATVTEGLHFLKMKGREIFKIAVRVMEQAGIEILEQHGLERDQIACVIPHQANYRIIETLGNRMGIPMDRFFINLDRYGNTSAASIPLALDEAVRGGRIKSGDLVLLLSFGAGLTWGSALIRWP